MKKYEVFQCEDQSKYSEVKPDFIYNRFDLWPDERKNGHVFLWCCKDECKEIYFEVLVEGSTARLGIWLMPIAAEALKHIIKAVFKSDRAIKNIVFENGFAPAVGKVTKKNHLRIELPDSAEELEKRLSKKGRYNIRRERRLLEEKHGASQVVDLPALSEKAGSLWEHYFKYKKMTHNTDYNMTISEYCDRYHVTNVYALLTGEEEHIAAIILSCEQCPIVYIENLTYDTALAEFSPGQILYDEYLRCLIRKGTKEIYLLGGDYSYKKRYGSIEETVFNCGVSRDVLKRLCNWAVGQLGKIYHWGKGKLKKEA